MQNGWVLNQEILINPELYHPWGTWLCYEFRELKLTAECCFSIEKLELLNRKFVLPSFLFPAPLVVFSVLLSRPTSWKRKGSNKDTKQWQISNNLELKFWFNIKSFRLWQLSPACSFDFCLIWFFTSTQQSFSYAGRSSWVEPVLS